MSDDLKMHDFKLPHRSRDEDRRPGVVLRRSLLRLAHHARRAPTNASSPSPPRWPDRPACSNFQDRFPDRFFDVGIAEQHAVTAAAGMAMGGLKPVVAVYSTFFSRAFDQAHLDVGLLNLPVVFVFDRAGITGDDGPSHHGLLDIALCLAIPNMTVFAPSSAEEVPACSDGALDVDARRRCGSPRPCRSPSTARSATDSRPARWCAATARCACSPSARWPPTPTGVELMGDEASKVTLYDVRVLPPGRPR
jgi:1-deoxy-D-xylulose-5-phosphate synthase